MKNKLEEGIEAASREGNLEGLKKLVSSIGFDEIGKLTVAVHLALQNDHKDIIKYLYGTELTVDKITDFSLLVEVVGNGDFDLVRFLCENKHTCDRLTFFDLAIMRSLRYGHMDIYNYLMGQSYLANGQGYLT